MNDKKLMNLAADNIRILAASMVEKAKSGHPGGAMGGADFINVLFSEFLVYDPENPSWEGRDRFFLDPGHMSPMLYSALALQGKFTIDELQQFRQWGSPTPGHPERDVQLGALDVMLEAMDVVNSVVLHKRLFDCAVDIGLYKVHWLAYVLVELDAISMIVDR